MSDQMVRPVLLVVDDEPENLALLERTFEFDYEVRTAASGQEALKLLPELPDLAVIITDQRMPGMTGTEFLTEARVRRADAVRIILTGHMGPEDLIDAINSSSVYRYVTKPWNVEKLRLTVRHAVRLYEMGGGALVDEATGLPNRGLLRRELEREMARAVRTQRPLAVVSVTIKAYRELKTNAGAAMAERLVSLLAQAMRSALRSIDLLGVYSDGVFVALLPECADVEVVAHRLGNLTAIERELAAARSKAKALELDVRGVMYLGGSSEPLALFRALHLDG